MTKTRNQVESDWEYKKEAITTVAICVVIIFFFLIFIAVALAPKADTHPKSDYSLCLDECPGLFPWTEYSQHTAAALECIKACNELLDCEKWEDEKL